MCCGIDWADDHHDVAVIDAEGMVVARRRITDTAAGFSELLDLLAAHGDGEHQLIPTAIETSRGLLVAALRATGRKVYATLWRRPATGTGMRSRARSLTTATPSSRPSPPSLTTPAPAPTTTGAAPPETATPPGNVTCSTG